MMHRTMGIAWKSLAVIAVGGTVTPDDGGMVAWAMKAVFGLMLAIIAYFVKQIADQMKDNQLTLAAYGKTIRRHQLVISYFMNQAKTELEARGETGGRRKADAALISLFEAIQSDGENDDA